MKYQRERVVNEPEAEPVSKEVEIKFRRHPIYNLYYGSKCGKYIHVKRKVINNGRRHRNGYMSGMIRAEGGKPKTYFVHRFIWECYNGLIPGGLVIDYINDIRDDNRLCNLQLVTQQENCKKSAKNRDYGFVKNNNQNKRSVKAINLTTNEEHYIPSWYSVQKNINCGMVKMVCEGLNCCKSGRSKFDNYCYRFEYLD